MEIDVAILVGWLLPPVTIEHLPWEERWLVLCTPRGISLVVTCCLADSIVVFSVTVDSYLQRDGVLINPLLSDSVFK